MLGSIVDFIRFEAKNLQSLIWEAGFEFRPGMARSLAVITEFERSTNETAKGKASIRKLESQA